MPDAPLVGAPHRVENIAPSADPALEEEFGSMARMACRAFPPELFDNRATIEELGYRPTPVTGGLTTTVSWLRGLGEL